MTDLKKKDDIEIYQTWIEGLDAYMHPTLYPTVLLVGCEEVCACVGIHGMMVSRSWMW